MQASTFAPSPFSARASAIRSRTCGRQRLAFLAVSATGGARKPNPSEGAEAAPPQATELQRRVPQLSPPLAGCPHPSRCGAAPHRATFPKGKALRPLPLCRTPYKNVPRPVAHLHFSCARRARFIRRRRASCAAGALHLRSTAGELRRRAPPPPKNKLDRRIFPLCFWAQFTHFLFKVRQKIKKQIQNSPQKTPRACFCRAEKSPSRIFGVENKNSD